MLCVTNLKVGVQVADTASAGAAMGACRYGIPLIRDPMKQACVAHFATVPEFADFILQ